MILKEGQQVVYKLKDSNKSVQFVYIMKDIDHKNTLIFVKVKSFNNYQKHNSPILSKDIWKITEDFLNRNVNEGFIQIGKVIEEVESNGS